MKTQKELTMADKHQILADLILQLEDALSFMETFESDPHCIGCICEQINEEDCTCVDEEGEHIRIKNKRVALHDANVLFQQINHEYTQVYNQGEDSFDESYRICSECGSVMSEGFVIDGGLYYYCSESCLLKNFSQETYNELYDDGNGESYWTSWE